MSFKSIGDYVELQRGTTYKSALLDQEGPYLLGLGSIDRDGGFRCEKLRTYGGPSADKLLVYPGDMYVSLKDVTQSGDLLGSVARVPSNIKVGRMTQDTVKLCFKSDISKEYFYWVLRSPQYRQHCRSHATGTTNLGLSRDDFFSFMVPELTIQREKITSVLEGIESKISLNKQINQTLEQMAQAIFKSWFVDFDPVKAKMNDEQPEGMDAATASLFPEKLVESELGLVPDGWDVEPLDSIFTVNKGLSYKGNFLSDDKSDVPLINLGNFGGNGKFRYEKVKYYSGDYKPRHVVKPGQLVIANTDMTQDRVILGSAILVPELGGEEYLTTHHTFSTSFKKQYPEDVWKYFVFYSLQRPSFRFRAEGFATGTTVLAMPKDAFTFCTVALPPVELVEKFSALVQSLKQKIACNEKENVELTNLRDILLPKLLSGEIELGTSEEL